MKRAAIYTGALALVATLGAIAFTAAPDELEVGRAQFDSARQAAREQAAQDSREALFRAERARP